MHAIWVQCGHVGPHTLVRVGKLCSRPATAAESMICAATICVCCHVMSMHMYPELYAAVQCTGLIALSHAFLISCIGQHVPPAWLTLCGCRQGNSHVPAGCNAAGVRAAVACCRAGAVYSRNGAVGVLSSFQSCHARCHMSWTSCTAHGCRPLFSGVWTSHMYI